MQLRLRYALLATALALAATQSGAATAADTAKCRLNPKQVVTRFMTALYIDKQVRTAFETWVICWLKLPVKR